MAQASSRAGTAGPFSAARCETVISVQPGQCTLPAAWTLAEGPIAWRMARNVYRLAVRNEHRREGIGLALTRAGEDYLRQCGVRRVTALAAFDDEDAGGF